MRAASRRRWTARARSISSHSFAGRSLSEPARSEIRDGGRSLRRTTSLNVSPDRLDRRSKAYASASSATVFVATTVSHVSNRYSHCVGTRHGQRRGLVARAGLAGWRGVLGRVTARGCTWQGIGEARASCPDRFGPSVPPGQPSGGFHGGGRLIGSRGPTLSGSNRWSVIPESWPPRGDDRWVRRPTIAEPVQELDRGFRSARSGGAGRPGGEHREMSDGGAESSRGGRASGRDRR